MIKIINVLKQFFKDKKDKCVICNKATPYEKQIHINHRKYYVECAGQLCEKCYFSLY